MGETARLIGLDWGSSSLRATLISAQGQVLSSRQSAQGASTLAGGPAAFCAALDALIADWMTAHPALPLLACGMVGSQHGWREAPYAPCPCDPAALAAQLVAVEIGSGRRLLIVPGLVYQPEGLPPDVMRGEETQLVGALDPELAEACMILPGTHAKWAALRESRVQGFATQMSGELFALLRQHSVLGRLMPPEAGLPDRAGFAEGVRAARDHGELGLAHQLFAVRTLGLLQRLPASGLADYLSGLLIGHELRAGLAWRARAGLAAAPLVLVGEPALCQRYEWALQDFDQALDAALGNTAAAGLWRLALAAGLV